MTQTANVAVRNATIIAFPKNRIIRIIPPEGKAALQRHNDQEHINENMQEISEGLMEELQCYFELDMNEPNLNRDYSYCMEVLKSVLYRNMGIEHPLHAFLDETVEVSETPVKLKNIVSMSGPDSAA